ncbi:MAG: hypothetical protein ACKPKE_02600, partial [Microcystis panniformis]
MRNVNLNILKFLYSINKFYLSFTNIGLEVSYQLSVISYQLSDVSFQFTVYWLLITENTPQLPLY